MKNFSYLSLLIIVKVCQEVYCECSGQIWTIQNADIGSFVISWKHTSSSNTVQFIIRGQVSSNINLTSTYVSIGWSNTTPVWHNMDMALFFPESQTLDDRHYREYSTPSLDSQQDFCAIEANITDQSIYVTFERLVTTDDTDDISFTSDVHLIFLLGSYKLLNDTDHIELEESHFNQTLSKSVSLINCTSSGCLAANCTINSCPCLQDVISNVGECACFSSLSCNMSSIISDLTTTEPAVSAFINGSCESESNACSGNGACVQVWFNQFICHCKPQYTGVRCETPVPSADLTILNLCQCVNGGVCLKNGTCSCTDHFRGQFCQLDNPCNDYCSDHGICTVDCTDTSCDQPICTCSNGYTGDQCNSLLTDVCEPNPCINGYCTKLSDQDFACHCDSGFIGTLCNTSVDCLSNPCNQGTCIISTNCTEEMCHGYSCLCSNDTTGTYCEINIDPCLNRPCKNGGHCSVSSNNYSCQCVPPYEGTNCDLIIDACTSNPCLNNGSCTRNSSMHYQEYSCECEAEYMGTHCEYFNGCSSSPCQNNGQCISSTTNCSSTVCPISCACLNGTMGVYCELHDTSCLWLPCLNDGLCLLNEETNNSYCQCPLNTTGSRCETIQPLCTNAICLNNGTCLLNTSSTDSTISCLCSEGYTGTHCETPVKPLNSCSSKPCGPDGTCIPTSANTYYCICLNGVIGQSCNSSLFHSCDDAQCRHLSTCQQVQNTEPPSYKCVCPSYLTGDRCQYTNTCQKEPCLNQGTCVALGPQNNFICLCPPGYGHYDCSIYLGLSCDENMCLNGGICDDNGTDVRCLCPENYAGSRCEWTSVCSPNTCQNGGTCRQIAPTMAECICQSGFTGPTCSLMDSCVTSPCKRGGGCTTLLVDTGTPWSAYRCICPPGIYGQNCNAAISSCAFMNCPPYKVCIEKSTGPECVCAGNKIGDLCQYDNPCNQPSTMCHNGATCILSSIDPPISSCLCPDEFTGTYCEDFIAKDPCSSNPCQEHGHCALSTSNTTYTCLCQKDFMGERCERRNPCSSSPCLNQGMCQVGYNQTDTWFSCLCVGTHTGIRCETSMLSPCGGLCAHGSSCSNGTCVCPDQYTGIFCEFENPCYNNQCQNGGTCSVILNRTSVSFLCACPSSHTGQHCDISLHVPESRTCSPECLNGGSCIRGMCRCTSSYIGPLCEYENPCEHKNPCLNNGTCLGQYHADGTLTKQCSCSEEFTGKHCESILCSSSVCNGGICTTTQNNLVCLCPKGRFGERCQYIDICAMNPCLPDERCEQTGYQYQCATCYDKSPFCKQYKSHNQYCDDRFTISIDGENLPVPQACQLSCGKCMSIPRLKNINSLLHNAGSNHKNELLSNTTMNYT